jgi:hypothetical protein
MKRPGFPGLRIDLHLREGGSYESLCELVRLNSVAVVVARRDVRVAMPVLVCLDVVGVVIDRDIGVAVAVLVGLDLVAAMVVCRLDVLAALLVRHSNPLFSMTALRGRSHK